MAVNLKGRCNCNAIQYEVTDEIVNIVNCHCNLCRQMNGGAFSTYAIVPAGALNIEHPKLAQHPVSENAHKHFCQQCGTPIFNTNQTLPQWKMIHFGSLDEALKLAPRVNIYTESEVSWLAQMDDMHNLEQGPK